MAAEEAKKEEAAPVVESPAEAAAPAAAAAAAEESVAPAAEESKEEAKEESTEEAKEESKEEAAPAKEEKPKQQLALEEFKLKVEEAIKANAFVPPPPPPPAKEEAPAAAAEEAPKDETPAPAPAAEGEAPKVEVAEAPAAPATAAASEAPKEEVTAAASEAAAAAAAAEAPKAEEQPAEAVAPKSEVAEVSEEAPAAAEPAAVAAEEAAAVEPEEVFLWGIPLSAAAGDERTDVILTKFLQARDFKVPAALAMLKNTVLWRKSYKADDILEEAPEESGYEALAYMFGLDKEGHPVCYNGFGALQNKELYAKVVGEDSAKFIRWRVGLLEKGIKLLNFEPSTPNALIQVIDLKNSPWPAKKELRLLIGQAIGLLQDNYPELVTKNVFINVPWFYSAVYSIISPFLTQRQKNKIVVARPGKSAEALFKFISPENVPLHYGGLGRRSDDTEFAGAEAPPTDLILKANEKKTVELPVTMSNATVTWDVVVIGYDVSYAAEFQPDKEGGYTTIIEKPKKVLNDDSSDDKPIRSSFTTSEPGKVVLTVDNLSRKKKMLVYRYIVKAAAA